MNARFRAIESIRARKADPPPHSRERLREYYRVNVFDDQAMRHYLSEEVHEALQQAVDHGNAIDRQLATPVAHAMKAWAIEKGATHYTHWFQPVSGLAAEKHDSFLDFRQGEAIEKFSADELVQQEPGAFPLATGGVRSTFEARGLTAWDCSSPAFLFETQVGKTLCVPTIFVAYTGEALDFKIPLLKSIASLDEAAVALAQLFDKSISRVVPTLGIEQEFFLVDQSLYDLRPDLMLTGRTLMGAPPARNSQIGQRFFGAISERTVAFLDELEREALKLGIPITTRHNEVAPAQLEVALQFEELNVAIDHGQLLMDLLDRTARRHHFRVLLHEKPFPGVNGSAKHNNWSIHTSGGKNLLSPGSNPKENLMFLAFFTSVIRAVALYPDLLRASVASAGNDRRLGTEEAPPLIMSVFVGRALTQIMDDIEHPPRKSRKQQKNPYLKLGISKIPELLLDNTDRNRTAPFAFTGNKFEFRAVGASSNSAQPMTMLNIIAAEQFRHFLRRVNQKMARSRKKELAVLDIIRENIVASKVVRFEGDSSTAAWQEEAKSRGLTRSAHTPEALRAYITREAIALFESAKIFTESEIRAHQAVLVKNYTNQIRTEANMLAELLGTILFPMVAKHLGELGPQAGHSGSALKRNNMLRDQLDQLWELSEVLENEMRKGDAFDASELAEHFANVLVPLMGKIRQIADRLEQHLPDVDWPLPKSRELLFIH